MLKRALPALRRPAALVLIVLGSAAAAAAQTGTVSVARENFRSAPSGPILAEVRGETVLPLGDRRDRWVEATLEGWVWGPSVREEEAEGHDIVVTATRGENLRGQPNGPILARLRPGTRLTRIEAQDRWIHVRRTGWVWEPSLEVEEAESDPPPVPQGTPSAQTRPAQGVAADNAASGPTDIGSRAGGGVPPSEVPAGAASAVDSRFTVAGPGGATVLENPSGDTLARVAAGSSVQVLAREGEWARVRIEGWALAGSLGAADTASLAVLRDVSADALSADPERYRGRLVEWSIQFIALQEAERFRRDFIEGEPFILARGPGDAAGFVYLAVPPERIDEVRGLAPLQRLRVLARVRNARSDLTGAPVLDLLQIGPARDR